MQSCDQGSVMGEWWINNSGLNLLKGAEGDDDNPRRLTDDQIIDFLRRIPAARDSFERLVPTMLEDEQERLRGLAVSAFYLASDPKTIEDAFQSRQNKAGVRTTGPRGGTRIGGN